MPWSDAERRKEYHRDYYENNKIKWSSRRKLVSDDDRARIREASFVYRLKTVYGLTRADYEAMLAKQNGKCAICDTQQVKGKAKQMHVDHCHATNRVRGLLCMRCNTALGWFEKNSSMVAKYMSEDA